MNDQSRKLKFQPARLYSSLLNKMNGDGNLDGNLIATPESKLKFEHKSNKSESYEYEFNLKIPTIVEFLLGSLDHDELCAVIESCSKKLRQLSPKE